MQDNLKLIHMHEVEAEEIKWLWYPYIPFGKITVIQGDSGDRKTTAVLAVAAAVTTGAALPENKAAIPPANVIFQTAEDGLGDTVKPRLVQAAADCSRAIIARVGLADVAKRDFALRELGNLLARHVCLLGSSGGLEFWPRPA